eukprot:3970596-Pyramimonas_sp.AAC.1
MVHDIIRCDPQPMYAALLFAGDRKRDRRPRGRVRIGQERAVGGRQSYIIIHRLKVFGSGRQGARMIGSGSWGQG